MVQSITKQVFLMEKIMIFEILGEPMGKQRPKFTRIGNFTRAYTPKETVNYENWVKLSYQNFGGEYFGDVELSAIILATMPIPKSWSIKKRNKAKEGEIPPKIKPDCDNIAKIILDALNGIAYDDDKQIVELIVKKEYGEEPKVIVELKKFEKK